jgi:hypothetical protein
MNLRRALFIAACMFAAAAGPVAAQFPPMQQPQQAQPQQPQEMPPCIKEFFKLRDDTQKKADAIKTASERKVGPAEACPLFTAFSAAEEKMMKYAADNGVWCGIPASVLVNLKKGHAQTTIIRTKVCQAAAAPQRPAAPSLSDALTGPVPDTSNIRTGRGTYDTLTGTPLGKQ